MRAVSTSPRRPGILQRGPGSAQATKCAQVMRTAIDLSEKLVASMEKASEKMVEKQDWNGDQGGGA